MLHKAESNEGEADTAVMVPLAFFSRHSVVCAPSALFRAGNCAYAECALAVLARKRARPRRLRMVLELPNRVTAHRQSIWACKWCLCMSCGNLMENRTPHILAVVQLCRNTPPTSSACSTCAQDPSDSRGKFKKESLIFGVKSLGKSYTS